MPKVNVVLPGGRVVSVDEDLAAQAQAHVESAGGGIARATEAVNEERTSGALEGLKAAGEGALDTLTLGGYGALAPDEYARNMQIRAQHRPGARFAGELGAMVVPGLGEAGLLGDVGRGVAVIGDVSGLGLAARAGEAVAGVAGKTVGRLAEGAILGAGGTVAHTNVTGDPLSVEGLVEGAGVGGILNVGAGVLADKLTRSSQRAKAAIDEAEQLARDTEVASAKAGHFESDAGVNTAYKQAVTAVKDRQAVARKALREWDTQAEAYNSFARGNRLTRAVEDAENTVRSVRQRYSPHPPAGQTPAGQHPGFDVTDVEGAPGAKGLDVEWIDGKPRAIHYKFDAEGNESKILHTSKPPISDELDGRLRDYQARISRIYQMKGGRSKLSAGGRWAPPNAADAAADPEVMMGELRQLYSDLQRDFPKAAGKLKPIPEPLPPRPPEPANVELAPNFKAFTRQHPDTVARLANSMDDATKAEFQRLNVELGVDPAAGIADVHNSAREWLSAIDRMDAETAKRGAEGGKGFFEIARRFMRNTIRFKAGWAAAHAIGGPLGSAVGSMTSALTGSAIDTVDNALVGGALLTAKTGVRARIQSVVAKYGGRTATGIEALGPAAAWLSRSHLTGSPDPETELRRQARNRVDELHGAVTTAPDTAYTAVEPLLGHPSDVAFKVYQQVTNAINHLAQTAPLDPGLDIKMFSSKWTPAWHEAVALAHRLEAVHAPLNALARLLTGQGHAAAADTLWAVWPALMNEAAGQIVEKASQGEYDTRRASAFSRIFRVPLTGLQNPVMITALQGNYLPQPGPGGNSKPPQPSGRPPAVSSPIAGSNVGALMS